MAISASSFESGTRTFVSCHRYDPFRRFIIRFLLPGFGFLVVIAFLVLSFMFSRLLGPQVPDEIRGQVGMMVGALALTGCLIGGGFLLLAWNLNRRFFGTSIQCDLQGLRYRSGSQEIEAPWDSIQIGRVLELGRMQSAVIHTHKGKIRMDPSYVDESRPHPRVRVSYGKEFLLYPDGTRVPFKIRENELFTLIEEQTRGGTAQPSRER